MQDKLNTFAKGANDNVRNTRYRAIEKIQHETEMRAKAWLTENMLYIAPFFIILGGYFFYGLYANSVLPYPQQFNFLGYGLYVSFAIGVFLSFFSLKFAKPIISKIIGEQHKEISEDVYVKGAKFCSTKEYNSEVTKYIAVIAGREKEPQIVAKLEEFITIKTDVLDEDDKLFEKKEDLEDLKIARIALATGLIIFGTPGSGKSVFINQIINQIPENPSTKSLIIDYKGDFTIKHFHKYYDKIICPTDIRSVRFDIHELVETAIDAANIANIIVTDDKQTQDPHWTNSARAVMEAVLLYAARNSLGNTHIYKLISSSFMLSDMIAEDEECALIAGRYLTFDNDGGASKETLSILSTLARKAKVLQYMSLLDDLETEKISLKKWLADGEGGKIFLLADENLSSVFAPLYGVITSYLITQILSGEDTMNVDNYFILDELPRLGKSLGDNLEKALAVGRSKGIKIVAAAQGYSQIKEEFGDKKAESILDTTNSYISFQSNVGAQFVEKYFGKTTVLRNKEGFSFGMDSMADRVTVNRDSVKEALIDDSEIMRLKPFECFCKIQGCRDVFKTKLAPVFLSDQNDVKKYIENPKIKIKKTNGNRKLAKDFKNNFVNTIKARAMIDESSESFVTDYY